MNKIPWIGYIIEIVFERFRDEKDNGILTLTHIYLLFACSLPLWFCEISRINKLLLASGVIVIGIGDTAASFFGYYFGKNNWPNSRKTYEGTLACFIAQFLSFIILPYYFGISNNKNYLAIIFITAITSLMETFTKNIDNLILPLMQYILVFIFI